MIHLLLAVAAAAITPQDPAPPTLVPRPIVGQPAPELAIERWQPSEKGPGRVERTVSSGAGNVERDRLEAILAGMKGDPTLEKLHGAVAIIHRTATSDRAGWTLLVDLAEANRDRGVVLVSLTAESEAAAVSERLKSEGLVGPVGIAEPGSASPYARDDVAIVGPSGELVALASKPDEIVAGVQKALARTAAPRIERPLDAAVAAALLDYYEGRYEKAREGAEKLAEKLRNAADDAGRRAREDAELLVRHVEEQRRDLTAAAAADRADGAVEKLVDLDLVLSRGFRGDAARSADEHLKFLRAQSLLAGRIIDYRKLLDLLEGRPPFFPRRDDPAGRRLLKQLEGFLKSTPNDALAQQRSRALVERFHRRHG